MALLRTKTLADLTDSLADFLPDGRAFLAKQLDGTILRTFLSGLAVEFGRVEGTINDIAREHEIPAAKTLLANWEQALGIPDTVFKDDRSTLPDSTRVRDILVRLAKCHITTVDDYKELAQAIGFTVNVVTGSDLGILDAMFPVQLFDSPQTARFYQVVQIIVTEMPSVFPLPVPLPLGADLPNLLMRLLATLVPVNTSTVFYFTLPDLGAILTEDFANYLVLENGDYFIW